MVRTRDGKAAWIARIPVPLVLQRRPVQSGICSVVSRNKTQEAAQGDGDQGSSCWIGYVILVLLACAAVVGLTLVLVLLYRKQCRDGDPCRATSDRISPSSPAKSSSGSRTRVPVALPPPATA